MHVPDFTTNPRHFSSYRFEYSSNTLRFPRSARRLKSSHEEAAASAAELWIISEVNPRGFTPSRTASPHRNALLHMDKEEQSSGANPPKTQVGPTEETRKRPGATETRRGPSRGTEGRRDEMWR
ncbi:hypothetical protein F2P81_000130 [Scophthalmus maximus]|uniref:Uncharacterized protein n=2 Tax=Scophthalmus maximus TaxID=52904 RepID=A0A6A4TIF2_SCOMX|nr:hypothetical protein F2P81_000130 [Scophthalmus maximus]